MDQTIIKTSYFVENWSVVKSLVEKDNDIPNKMSVLKILDTKETNYGKELLLRALDRGVTYQYIVKNFLPLLRYGTSCVIWYKPLEEPQATVPVVKQELTPVIQTPIDDPSIVDHFKSPTLKIELNESGFFEKPGTVFAIKTNVAYLAATVLNLGVEIGFGKHYSIDFPVVYSPYTVKSTYKLKVLALQPEFRYWLKTPMKGHFFGVHAHVGWFNVAMNCTSRYQDNRPLFGAGISYGYALPFSKHWGAEFTIGAGYANMSYDVFYNEENGKQYDCGVKNYWGITKLGVTLIYKFNIK